ncbi:MAG: peptide ABC transporter substrate-binding protein, partial [Steroidobacteraceae bacterium]
MPVATSTLLSRGLAPLAKAAQAAAAALPVCAALVLASLLAACTGGQLTASVPSISVGSQLAADQVVNRALDAMPRSLDPSLSIDVTGQQVIDDLFEGLTTLDPKGNVIPGVATSWDVSSDGKTWTFHLRHDARWSNGDPVTAADFVYAWRREVDPKTAAEYAQALSPIVNALAIATGKAPVDSLGVTALDPHTLRVSLNAPTPYLTALLTDNYLQPVPRAAIERYGDAWTRPGHMVSDGPFELSAVVIGDRITLVKNPFYWDAAHVSLTRVTYYPLDDDTAQTERFLAGGLDYTSEFDTSKYSWLKSRLGSEVHTGPYFGTVMLG